MGCLATWFISFSPFLDDSATAVIVMAVTNCEPGTPSDTDDAKVERRNVEYTIWFSAKATGIVVVVVDVAREMKIVATKELN